MKKPFKTLFGERVIIENPVKEEQKSKSKIELLPETQEKENKKLLERTERFKILQVGTGCKKELKEGQEVYVESAMRLLHPQSAEVIIENSKIVGFIVPERNVSGIF